MKIFDWLIRYLPHKNIQSQIFNFYLNIKFLYKKGGDDEMQPGPSNGRKRRHYSRSTTSSNYKRPRTDSSSGSGSSIEGLQMTTFAYL